MAGYVPGRRPGETVTWVGGRTDGFGRVPEVGAVLGGGGWLVVAPFVEHAVRLFLLAPLVLVPLGLSLAATPTRDGDHALAYRIAVAIQPPAALLVVLSLTRAAGPGAGLLVLPWLLTTLVTAGFGLRRLTERGLRPLPETVMDAGLLYLPVGGAWLLAHRLDLVVVGFEGPIVLFTAVHFHYAGFVVPVAAGVGGRLLETRRRSRYGVLASVAIAGPAVVAAGIAASPVVEVVAVVAYTLAVTGLFATITAGVVALRPIAVAALVLATASVAVSMALALAYGVSTYVAVPVGLTDARMVALHGTLNAAFALLVLGGLRVVDPSPRPDAPVPGVPYSRLRSRGRVGSDFFRRRDLVAADRSALGMVDDLAAFDRPGFDPSAVAAPVRAVYERSADTELRLRATWSRGLRRPSRLLARVGALLEQFHLPAHGDRAGDLDGEVLAVDEPDGARNDRSDARAWTRWYAETGRTMYVASYETHAHEGTRYLDVAFPLPGCNLTGVLRPENDGDGLVLSSHRTSGDDAGLYLGTPAGLVRLPLAERLRLHPTDDGTVEAVHEVDLFGRHIVTLTYDIAIRAGSDDPAADRAG